MYRKYIPKAKPTNTKINKNKNKNKHKKEIANIAIKIHRYKYDPKRKPNTRKKKHGTATPQQQTAVNKNACATHTDGGDFYLERRDEHNSKRHNKKVQSIYAKISTHSAHTHTDTKL